MTRERVEDIVERLGNRIAEELEYELVDVQYRKEGSDWVLRCLIDCPEGVGINECQLFSEALGKVLDVEDPIPGHYLLEVSSPGVERPLKKDRDFTRFSGKKVEVKLHKQLNGKKIFQGELLGLSDGKEGSLLRIRTDGSDLEFARGDVARVHLISEIFGTEGGRKKK